MRTIPKPLQTPQEEFKALRFTLSAVIQAIKNIHIPPVCTTATTPYEAATALSPLLARACAPFLSSPTRGSSHDKASPGDMTGDNIIDLGSRPEALRDVLLDRLLCPLLSRVIYLAHTLTPSQGLSSQAPGHRKSGAPPPGMFSMLDFNSLRTALEVLVLWGIYPCLDDGAGRPLERREESKAVTLPPSVLAWGLAAVAAPGEDRGGTEQRSEREGQEQAGQAR